MTKQTVIIAICIALAFAGCAFSLISYNGITEYKAQLQARDKIISRYERNEALTCESQEYFTNTITKYVTNECGLVIDGKDVSMQGVVSLLNDRETKVSALKDTVWHYKTLLSEVFKRYGIKASAIYDGNSMITKFDSKRVDSAFLLLEVFRDRLTFNKDKNSWSIRLCQ